MIAEEANCSRYSKPILWTRYHLTVTAPRSMENEGPGGCKKIIHYGFDCKRTAELVWDELVKVLELSRNRIESLMNFDLNSLALTDVEGRMIKYLEKGKTWGSFPLIDRSVNGDSVIPVPLGVSLTDKFSKK